MLNRRPARRTTRLDAFIARIAAQRDCLNVAARLIAPLEGPVLELGLGNGRTFDHLRELFPERAIFVFDREVAAHPASTPEAAFLRLGDFRDTVAAFAREGRARAALAHADIGSPDRARDAALADWLGPALAPLLRAGALVVSDRAFTTVAWRAQPLPEGVAPGSYLMYRVE
jgi:hypothetical protein